MDVLVNVICEADKLSQVEREEKVLVENSVQMIDHQCDDPVDPRKKIQYLYLII